MLLAQRADQPLDLAAGGVAPGGELGVDQRAVDDDLEAAAFGGDQGEFADIVGELFEQRVRQTDGLGAIVSHHAEFNADSHRVAPCLALASTNDPVGLLYTQPRRQAGGLTALEDRTRV